MAQELDKGLSFAAVFALIITSMVGTSLFFGVATGAKIAGTASLISWALLGFVAIYVSACFGELIAMFPSSGGVYEFTKQSFGRFPSFLVGWISWIVSNVGSAVLVVGALEFMLPNVPGSNTIALGTLIVNKKLLKLAIAIALVVLFNVIAYLGIEASGAILITFAAMVIGLVALILVPGFTHFHAANVALPPLIPFGLVFVAAFFLVESFFGWESASFLAEETRDPERTVPRALLWASATVAILGFLLAFMMIGGWGADALAKDPNPLMTVASGIFPHFETVLVIGVFLTFISGVISNTIASPRLLFALARDRLFIEQCTKLHPKYRSPVYAIVFQAIVTIVVMLFAFGNYTFLLQVLVPLALIMYIIVLVAVPVLRVRKPNHPRPFRVWFGMQGPVVVAVFYLGVMLAWFFNTNGSDAITLLILGFIALSFPIYLFLMMVYNPDAIISVNDSAARFTYALEDLLLPRRVRRELIDLFRDHLRGKDVLEYGAGVGTFTIELADAVGPSGSVTAIDLSRSNLAILTERARKHSTRIFTIHDEHQVNRIHPDVHHVDVVYSIGFLGYVQDLHKILRELHSILPQNGRICFVEYTNFFKLLPDPALVSDLERLRTTFKEAGFAVTVKKRNGLLWNYLIIEGIKNDKNVTYV